MRKHKKKVADGLPFVLYSMKIKEQTRKLAAGCSKHCFEVADRTDEVSSKHRFEVVDETDEVSNQTYGRATMTWFEEIFEEY
ncbi:N-ethylammeline chlorohydrolase [Streptococcus pneumoniae]|nr:N-ethylammeline chlorohydrolase [Streptococcus pneumoniae]